MENYEIITNFKGRVGNKYTDQQQDYDTTTYLLDNLDEIGIEYNSEFPGDLLSIVEEVYDEIGLNYSITEIEGNLLQPILELEDIDNPSITDLQLGVENFYLEYIFEDINQKLKDGYYNIEE